MPMTPAHMVITPGWPVRYVPAASPRVSAPAKSVVRSTQLPSSAVTYTSSAPARTTNARRNTAPAETAASTAGATRVEVNLRADADCGAYVGAGLAVAERGMTLL